MYVQMPFVYTIYVRMCVCRSITALAVLNPFIPSEKESLEQSYDDPSVVQPDPFPEGNIHFSIHLGQVGGAH